MAGNWLPGACTTLRAWMDGNGPSCVDPFERGGHCAGRKIRLVWLWPIGFRRDCHGRQRLDGLRGFDSVAVWVLCPEKASEKRHGLSFRGVGQAGAAPRGNGGPVFWFAVESGRVFLRAGAAALEDSGKIFQAEKETGKGWNEKDEGRALTSGDMIAPAQAMKGSNRAFHALLDLDRQARSGDVQLIQREC